MPKSPAKKSNRKIPGRARVKRSRSGSRRPAAWKRILAHPFTPVLIGLALVLGVGFWAMRETAGQPGAAGGANEPASPEIAGEPGTGGLDGSPAETPAQDPVAPAHEAPDAAADEMANGAVAETADETTIETTDRGAAQPPAPSEAGDAASAARGQIDRSGGASETMLVTVYFADGLQEGASLQPVQIKVPFDLAVIKATARQIVDPPEELGLHSSVPAGTQVLETNLKDGVAIVNLSAALEEVRGAAAVNNIRASFVYSLTGIPGVEAVQLWTEGRPAVLDGYEWSRPVTRAEIESEGLYRVQDVIPYSGP